MSSRKEKRKEKNAAKKNWLVNIFLFLLLVIGLALIFNTQIRNWLIQENGKSYAISEITPKKIEENKNKEVSFDFDAVESLSTEAVLRAQLENKNLPVIGAVAIPNVKVNLPIFKGLSNVSLLTGAGTMKAEQQMGAEGNYALASHRIQDGISLFSPIERMAIGDVIYITDLTNIYTYKTSLVEKVDPSRVDLIDDIPGRKMITLVTCGDMDAITRIVVQGNLDSVTPINNATKDMLAAFEMEQLTL